MMIKDIDSKMLQDALDYAKSIYVNVFEDENASDDDLFIFVKSMHPEWFVD